MNLFAALPVVTGASVRTHAPHAVLTFDHFHVVKLMNERLDDLRREVVREATRGPAIDQGPALAAAAPQRQLAAGRRSTPGAESAPQRAVAMRLPAQGRVGWLWAQADGRQAWAFLREGCAKAKASGIRQLHAMADTLLRHAKGILADYQTGLTSGKMEGINRKIRGLSASAFGCRDHDFFKLRLYALHEAKFKLVG